MDDFSILDVPDDGQISGVLKAKFEGGQRANFEKKCLDGNAGGEFQEHLLFAWVEDDAQGHHHPGHRKGKSKSARNEGVDPCSRLAIMGHPRTRRKAILFILREIERKYPGYVTGCQERFRALMGTEEEGVRCCGSIVKGLPSPGLFLATVAVRTEANPSVGVREDEDVQNAAGKVDVDVSGEDQEHNVGGKKVDGNDIVAQGQGQEEPSEQTGHQDQEIKYGTSAVGTGAARGSPHNFGVNPKLSEDWGTDVFEIPPKIRDDFYDMCAEKNWDNPDRAFFHVVNRAQSVVSRASNCLVDVLGLGSDQMRIVLCGTDTQRRTARKYFELCLVLYGGCIPFDDV